MPTKHCAFANCTSDSRYLKHDGIKFVPFAKPRVDMKKCLQWIHLSGRTDLTIDKIKKHTYVCTKHFINPNGPTIENPNPLSATVSKIGSTYGMDLRLHSHEFISNFIDAFRQNPCLWNTLNPEYRNKKSRLKAYNRLLTFVRAIEPKITINEIKKKLQSIRASHRKERKKVEESLKTATNPADVYVPKLWYYNDLEFLHSETARVESSKFENSLEKSNNDNISVQSITIDDVEIKQQPNDDDDDDDDSEKSIISDLSLTSLDPINEMWPPDVSSYNTSRMEANNSVEQNLPTDDQNHILNYIASKLDTEKDEFDVFGKNVAAELRKMSSKQRIIAKKLMNDVIFHGQLEHLTVDAQIQVNKFDIES